MIPIIFVPSKGRAGKSKTIENLLEEGTSFVMVNEPQEQEQYADAYPEATQMVLDKDNQGIGYVRQFILKWCRSKDLVWYWMLDDDISSLCEQVGNKNIKKPFREILQKSFDLFADLPEVGQAALEYQQFSWGAKKDLTFNSYCDVAVCINVCRTCHVNYRSRCDLKEDRDFTLQILNSGLRTVRTGRFGFAAPKNGSNEGGLQASYAQPGREIEAVKIMCSLWPDVVTLQTKADGRVDCKINWRFFKKNA